MTSRVAERSRPCRFASSRNRRTKLGTPHSTVGLNAVTFSSASASECRTLNSDCADPVSPLITGMPAIMPERITLRNAPVGKSASG